MPLSKTALIFGTLLFVTASFAQNAPPPPEVTVARPVSKDIVEDDEFVGRFDAAEQVEVRARVSGYLEQVNFRDGALVEKGALLYSIDRRLFEAALRQAEAQVSIAEAGRDFAQEQMDRAMGLSASGNISQSTVDERRQGLLSANGALEQARQQLETAQINLGFSTAHASRRANSCGPTTRC